MLPDYFLDQFGIELAHAVFNTNQDYRMAATPIDRLKSKFLQARGVAQRVATNMEAEADSLIAQEDAFKAKTASAFAPHKAILAEAGSELKAIEDALNLMSNGGPPLDGAAPIAHDSPSPQLEGANSSAPSSKAP